MNKAHARETRGCSSYWRRLPTFGYQEIPRDTTENCLAYCNALYGKLLQQSLLFQACTGVCATIDECSGVADCVADTSCINTAEGFMCLCPSGYQGDGRISGEGCMDVDECADATASCVPDANCTNTEGGYICQCGFGFNGDGRSSGTGCINILPMLTQLIEETVNETFASQTAAVLDMCQEADHDCVAEAPCVTADSMDGFLCLCPDGYSGDGRMSGTGCNPNQPVVQMVSITVNDTRTAQLRSISASTLNENTSPLATFSIADASQPQTSGGTFAYRPNYADDHTSNIGVLLFGLRAAFPCIGATANPKPICSVFTHNNGGFHGGRPFIEASFERFETTNLPVYGFGVEGCPELTPDCFPSGQEVAIICYLPRDLCGDGPGL